MARQITKTTAAAHHEVLRERNKRAAVELGERLRQARIERCISQEELATRAGLGPGTVARIEGSHQSPRVSTLVRLADVLEIAVWKLIDPGGPNC